MGALLGLRVVAVSFGTPSSGTRPGCVLTVTRAPSSRPRGPRARPGGRLRPLPAAAESGTGDRGGVDARRPRRPSTRPARTWRGLLPSGATEGALAATGRVQLGIPTGARSFPAAFLDAVAQQISFSHLEKTI